MQYLKLNNQITTCKKLIFLILLLNFLIYFKEKNILKKSYIVNLQLSYGKINYYALRLK